MSSNLAAWESLSALYVLSLDLNLSSTKLYAAVLFFPGIIRGWPRWIKLLLIFGTGNTCLIAWMVENETFLLKIIPDLFQFGV
jgi:hypothetical protein